MIKCEQGRRGNGMTRKTNIKWGYGYHEKGEDVGGYRRSVWI